MPATAQDLIDRLAEHRTLSAAPRTELEWLVAHGSIRELNTGEAVECEGSPGGGSLHRSFRANWLCSSIVVPGRTKSLSGMKEMLPACCRIRGS